MKRSYLWASLLVLSCGFACTSHSQDAERSQSSNTPADTNVLRRSAATPEVKLTPSTNAVATRYPSASTQTVAFTVGNMDESKGISVTGGNGCTINGSPEKTGASTYMVNVVIPSEAEDGNCDIGVASTASGAYMSAEVPYSADPDYFKKTAPAIYAFANSKTWTFKTSSGKTETQTVMNVQNSANRIAAMTKGSDDSVGVFGFSPPDQVAGTYAGCVMQGTLSNGTATLKPILESDECKKIGTVTIKAAN